MSVIKPHFLSIHPAWEIAQFLPSKERRKLAMTCRDWNDVIRGDFFRRISSSTDLSLSNKLQRIILRVIGNWGAYAYCQLAFTIPIRAENFAQFSSRGDRFITGSLSSPIANIRDVKTGTCLCSLIGHSLRIYFASFSPDDQLVITLAFDNTAKIWDTQTGACLGTLGKEYAIRSACFSSDGAHVITSSADQSIRNWDIKTNHCHTLLQLPLEENLRFYKLSPQGKWVVTASKNNTIKLWDPKTKRCHLSLETENPLKSAFFSPLEDFLILIYNDSAQIYNTTATADPQILNENQITAAEFSPDAKWIITLSSKASSVKIWDPRTGRCYRELPRNSAHLISAKFSPDTKWVITTSKNGPSLIFDVETGKCSQKIPPIPPTEYPSYVFLNVAMFSPDGEKILVTKEGVVQMWDILRPATRYISLLNGTNPSSLIGNTERRIFSRCRQTHTQLIDITSQELENTPRWIVEEFLNALYTLNKEVSELPLFEQFLKRHIAWLETLPEMVRRLVFSLLNDLLKGNNFLQLPKNILPETWQIEVNQTVLFHLNQSPSFQEVLYPEASPQGPLFEKWRQELQTLSEQRTRFLKQNVE